MKIILADFESYNNYSYKIWLYFEISRLENIKDHEEEQNLITLNVKISKYQNIIVGKKIYRKL